MALGERIAILLTAEGAQATAEFRKVSSAAKQLGADTTLAEGALGKFGAAGKLLGGAAAGPAGLAVGLGIAATAAFEFGKKGVEAFETVGLAAKQVQLVTGSSAQDASKLSAAFTTLGVDADQGATSLFRLGKNATENAEKLEKHGVAITKNRDGTVNLSQSLLSIADAYKKAGGGAEGDTIAFEAFGRQGKALIPVLAQGREGLQQLYDEAGRHGLILDQSEIDKAYQFKIATRELGQSFQGLEVQVGEALIPTLLKLTGTAETVLSFFDKLGHNEAFADVAKLALRAVVPLVAVSDVLGAVGVGGSKASHGLAEAQVSLEEAAKAADETTVAYDTLRSESQALESSDIALTKAHKDVADASHAAADKEEELAKARNSLVDANATLADDVAAVKTSQEALNVAQHAGEDRALRLADAQQSLKDANLSVVDAQEKLNEAEHQAPKDLVQARQNAASATVALADAEDRLAKTSDKFGGDSIEARKAVDAVAQAKLRLTDANDAAAKAEKDKDHPRAVADAERTLEQARRGVRDATAAVNKVEAENPTEKVEAAKRALERAERAVATQRYAIADAQKKINDVEAQNPADKQIAASHALAAATLAHQIAADKLQRDLEKVNVKLHTQIDLADVLNSKLTLRAGDNGGDFSAGDRGFGGQGGTTNNITVHATTGADAQGIAQAIAWAL